MARSVAAWSGEERQSGSGVVWPGWLELARQAGSGLSRRGKLRLGSVSQGRHVKSRMGVDRTGTAR